MEQDWPEGWRTVSGAEAAALNAQAAREMGATHELAWHGWGVIGRSDASDDVVVAVDHWIAPFALLHLRWDDGDGVGPEAYPILALAELADAV